MNTWAGGGGAAAMDDAYQRAVAPGRGKRYDVYCPEFSSVEFDGNAGDEFRPSWEACDPNCSGQLGPRHSSPCMLPPDTPSPYMRPSPLEPGMMGSGEMLPPAFGYVPSLGGQSRPSTHHSSVPELDSSSGYHLSSSFGGCGGYQCNAGSCPYPGIGSSPFNTPYSYQEQSFLGPAMSQGPLLEGGRARLQCPTSGHKAMKQPMQFPSAPDQYKAQSMKHDGRQRLEKNKPKHAAGGWVNNEVGMSDIAPCDATGSCTTAMLRNIPNKYTRDMLKERLNQEFRGKFNFLYLPIDFKNKCNVGYGFINFITTWDCQLFAHKFHGVEVQTCLPGLNSRKVAAVTAARVQGYEENVRRLLNGPVMGELMQNPLWMPLVFDDFGNEETFPMPDQICSPIKHRKKPGMSGKADRESHH